MSFNQNLMGGAKNWLVDKGADLISGVGRNRKNANRVNHAGMQRFITNIQSKNGLYRGAFFEVYIHGLRDHETEHSLNLICHQAALPGFRLETKDNIIYGLPYETPVGVVFDPLWMTFYIDNEFTVNNAIWQQTFNSEDAHTGRINPQSYSPKYRDPTTLFHIDIMAYTIDDTAAQSLQTIPAGAQKTFDGLNVIAMYSMKNCFFKAVQQVPVDWSAQNSVTSVTAEISYEYYEAKYPSTSVVLKPNVLKPPVDGKTNFDTMFAKFPGLSVAYDAAKRTAVNNPAIMNNPILNQGGQFLP